MPTNREVFIAFAKHEAKSSSSVHSERAENAVVLYSYATPIAYLKDGEDVPVFSDRRFSATTSKQQTQAKAVFTEVQMVDDHIFRMYAEKVGAYFGMAR